jgi:hypothetical protein
MKDLRVINLKDWEIRYTKFVQWAVDSGADVYAIFHHGGAGATTQYGFESKEDYIAFKIKFERTEDSLQVQFKDFYKLDITETNYS